MNTSGARGPFVIVAAVIVGCLGAGVALATFIDRAAALVVSVVLACAVASLLYGILGGVSQAGFNFGPLKMGGSAAVLLGSVFLFNRTPGPQLAAIRAFDVEEAVAKALRNAEFDFDTHVNPSANWFAIDRTTAAPIDVGFTDPRGNEPAQIVRRPAGPVLRLKLEQRDESSLPVMGVDADSSRHGLGFTRFQELEYVVGSFGEPTPGRIYGPQRLHLVADGEPAEDTPRQWGSSERCLGTGLPMRLRAVRFDRGYADFEVFVCGSGAAAPGHVSSLASGDGERLRLEIDGETRQFPIAALAADRAQSPFRSSFPVTEMAQDPTARPANRTGRPGADGALE